MQSYIGVVHTWFPSSTIGSAVSSWPSVALLQRPIDWPTISGLRKLAAFGFGQRSRSRVTDAAALFILEPERADELAEPIGLLAKEAVKFVGRHVLGLRTNGGEEG